MDAKARQTQITCLQQTVDQLNKDNNELNKKLGSEKNHIKDQMNNLRKDIESNQKEKNDLHEQLEQVRNEMVKFKEVQEEKTKALKSTISKHSKSIQDKNKLIEDQV